MRQGCSLRTGSSWENSVMRTAVCRDSVWTVSLQIRSLQNTCWFFFNQVTTVKITHMRVLMWDCWNSKFRMLFFSIPQEPVNVTQALVVLIARSTQQWHPMCGSWRMLGCVISVTGGAMRWRCLGAHSSSQTISSVNSLVSR